MNRFSLSMCSGATANELPSSAADSPVARNAEQEHGERQLKAAGRPSIAPLAFVGWTMLQWATAFDAVFPCLAEAPRTVDALFLAAFLGLATVNTANKADKKTPPRKGKQEVDAV